MRQAYYHSSIENFLNDDNALIVGKLNKGVTSFASQWTITTTSWESLIEIVKASFVELISQIELSKNWMILLEYEIPRLSSRIDAVVIADDLVFVIEFKYERSAYELADVRQAEDYANDLKDFHSESRNRLVLPILLAPNAKGYSSKEQFDISNNSCLRANRITLAKILLDAYLKHHNPTASTIDSNRWELSEYHPTPTIIQAAKALFAGQKVDEITRFGADNLGKTSKFIIEVIKQAKKENEKVICFVTGVPGAGKTLVGLNIVHEQEEFSADDDNAAYFSGNVPLINVLREALTRDDYKRKTEFFASNKTIKRPTKKTSEREIKSKIQNLHLFIKDGIRKDTPPNERIVVFDEAQRCWNAKHFSNKAKQNQNRENNPFLIEEKSEAELLFEFMNRHNGWAVIIALVGGGQEINTGEGGIAEWGDTLQKKYSNWVVYVAPELLVNNSSVSTQPLFKYPPKNLVIRENSDLHLSVSQRSFKATDLNNWVNAVIDNRPQEANRIADTIKKTYPILISRNIVEVKNWLKGKKSGTKRIGLVASSGALRLKPYAINVREEIDETLWFLNDENDVRSSFYLETVASEYKVQGLELDFIGVCWDADLRRGKDDWQFRSFSGSQWNQVNNISEQNFLLNTYRVLLTRAREGLIVFIPEGDIDDKTRPPELYNSIFEYLKSCGIQEM